MKWDKLIKKDIKDKKKVAIVIGLSAGKDSTAVALLFRKKFPKMKAHYIFSDTGEELKETYEYLDRIEKTLKIKINRVMSKDGTLGEQIKGKQKGYLPSATSRYCTRIMKIIPFKKEMKELAKTHDKVYNLVGIRADEEDRKGYIAGKKESEKVVTLMPLKDDGLVLKDVFKLVKKEIGLPNYYDWRTRSGCYFCFYQRRIEWVHLKERHPDLFEKAKSYEKKGFSWIKDLPLSELEKKAPKIKQRYLNKLKKMKTNKKNISITDESVYDKLMDELEPDLKDGCQVCEK